MMLSRGITKFRLEAVVSNAHGVWAIGTIGMVDDELVSLGALEALVQTTGRGKGHVHVAYGVLYDEGGHVSLRCWVVQHRSRRIVQLWNRSIIVAISPNPLECCRHTQSLQMAE